jgi:hypothetical protein
MRGFFDFETWEWIHPLCAGFAWGPPGQRRMHFIKDESHTNPDSVVDQTLLFLENAASAGLTEWWAHNMGKFDGLFICEGAARMGWSVTAAIAGSRMVVLNLTTKTGVRIVMKDSIAVVPGRLGAIAEDWLLPHAKLFTKDDYSVDVRQWAPQRLKEGCLTDCLVGLELLESVEAQVEQWGGELKATFSSTALSVLTAQLKTQDLVIPSHQGFQRQNDFCHKSYYGARVEVIHHAPTPLLIEYDVCSSYPWSMTQPVPWELLGLAKNKQALMRIFNGELEGVLRARVTVPECEYPPLPYRPKSGGVYFPVGTWESNFAACELRYAVEQGCQVKLLDGVAYTQASPFEQFVRRIYSMKDTTTGAVRNFCKLVLNGCYGKFGQSPYQESLVIAANLEIADELIARSGKGKISRISDDPRFLAQKTFRWPKQTHYAIASYITARSRILLHMGMVNSSGLAYLDTDSLHCVSLDFNNFVRQGKGLGDFKVEIAAYKGRFYAPKMYHLEERPDWGLPSGHYGPRGKEHFACKGFPVEREAFMKMIAGEDVEVERMQGIKTQMKKGGKVFRYAGELAEKKRWKGRSIKRFPFPDGSTRPWSVEEIERKEHEKAESPMGYNE